MKQSLTVFASQEKDALVPNIQALSANPPQRRFIGWKYNPEAGEAGGWERKLEAETIPYHNDYVKAIKEGDLLPADEQTAQLCGLPWKSRKSNQDNKPQDSHRDIDESNRELLLMNQSGKKQK